MRRLAALLAVTLAAPAAAWADGIVLNSSNETRKVECTKDMSEVVVNGSGNTITATGACAKVVVNSSKNKITAAAVEKIAVNGADNEVAVDATDKIAVTGTGNKITWKKGLKSDKPKVVNMGANNSVKQAP